MAELSDENIIGDAEDSIRVFRGHGSLLIAADGRYFRITDAQAHQLLADLCEMFSPPPPAEKKTKRQRLRWTPELRAKLVSDYVEKDMGPAEIARDWGVNVTAIASALSWLRVPPKDKVRAEKSRASALARHAARRATE